jgi:predicted glycosyltransferase
MTGRVLFYVQHLLGVGHLKRAESLAIAMAEAGLDVTVALGGRPLPDVPFSGMRVAQLPPARIAGEDFSTLVDEHGSPVDETWRATRREALFKLYEETDPDVVLIELYPFGRRQFRFELLPLLEHIHGQEPKPFVASSVRDILVASRKPGRDAEVTAVLRMFFDAVFVHGDPALIPFERTFPAASDIADLIRYTGYVTGPAAEARSAEGQGEVLVSAGGGAVGAPLLRAALAARPLTELKDHVWRLLTGPNLPADVYDQLSAVADRNTIVERFRPDFPARLGVAALSISQAGYNTTMDLLRSGVRAVVIPYETGGETEQRLRSEILASKGLLTVVPADELSPERLAAAVAAALKTSPNPAGIDTSGAARTASMVSDLARRRRPGERHSAETKLGDCQLLEFVAP